LGVFTALSACSRDLVAGRRQPISQELYEAHREWYDRKYRRDKSTGIIDDAKRVWRS